MAEVKNYITKEGAEKLRAEYLELLNVERPKLVETVAWAAGNGDRSENGDYIYGKRRLRQIDGRLKFLRDRLDAAVIVDLASVNSDKVVFGATVTLETLEDEDDKLAGTTLTYQIVGEEEIDLKVGRISWRSPLGKALLGKSEGDEIEFKSPTGLRSLILLKISYQSAKSS